MTDFQFIKINICEIKKLPKFILKNDSILKQQVHKKTQKQDLALYTVEVSLLKSTWKGIKNKIYYTSSKNATSNVLQVLPLNDNNSIINRYDTANAFNIYFALIAKTST